MLSQVGRSDIRDRGPEAMKMTAIWMAVYIQQDDGYSVLVDDRELGQFRLRNDAYKRGLQHKRG